MPESLDTQEVMDHIVPVLSLRQDIEAHTMLRPTALMLPLSLLPHAERVYGMSVVRGDRVALLYEAVRPRA